MNLDELERSLTSIRARRAELLALWADLMFRPGSPLVEALRRAVAAATGRRVGWTECRHRGEAWARDITASGRHTSDPISREPFGRSPPS